MKARYLVYVDGHAGAPTEGPACIALTDGLYLVRTEQTRSQLYHSVKRHLNPRRLLVAPLSETPKFMGMRPGALKKLKAGDRE